MQERQICRRILGGMPYNWMTPPRAFGFPSGAEFPPRSGENFVRRVRANGRPYRPPLRRGRGRVRSALALRPGSQRTRDARYLRRKSRPASFAASARKSPDTRAANSRPYSRIAARCVQCGRFRAAKRLPLRGAGAKRLRGVLAGGSVRCGRSGGAGLSASGGHFSPRKSAENTPGAVAPGLPWGCAACIPRKGIAQAVTLHRAVPPHTACPFPASRGPVESDNRYSYRTFH